MTKYMVVIAHDHRSLEAHVSDWIAHGWQPIGGLAIDSTDRMFYQSMIHPGS